MLGDTIPSHLMTPDRRAWASALGLAQGRSAPAMAIGDPAAADTAPVGAPRTSVTIPEQLGGETIDGHAWLVLQLPAGRIRASGEESHCWTTAKHLAITEGGAFAIFQPKGLTRPETTVTEERL